MDQKSFKLEIFITKIQLEQSLLPYCNLQFASEELDGSVSMYSYDKSGLQFRSLLLPDA